MKHRDTIIGVMILCLILLHSVSGLHAQEDSRFQQTTYMLMNKVTKYGSIDNDITKILENENLEENAALLFILALIDNDSENNYKKALELLKKVHEDDLQHPDIALVLNNLASLYDKQGKYAEAEPLYKEAINIYKIAYKDYPNHPYIATSLNNLASLYDKQGKYTEAELLYKEALKIRKIAHKDNPSHPDITQSLNNLESLYDKQGKYTEAELLYADATPANPAIDFEYTKSDDEVTITALKDKEMKGEVVIPRKIDGLPVTNIGDRAFYNCRGLTSMTIPASVTSIGDRAFFECSGLRSLTIPASVTSIGGGVFSLCDGLTSIKVDSRNACYQVIDGVLFTKDGKTIHSYPAGKKGSYYRIPASVTSIGDGAFDGCGGLMSLTIPASVTSIGERAFSNCRGLTSLTIPAGVTSIGEGAFAGFDGLTSIEVASGNACYQVIDGVLFTKDGKTIHRYPAGKKGSSYRIPEGVTSIGNWAFFGCSGLTSLTIPASVTSIGDGAFSCCEGLMSMTIPASVASIGDWAFFGCSGLTSLTIPASVTSIGDGAFGSCCNILTIRTPKGSAAEAYAKENNIKFETTSSSSR